MVVPLVVAGWRMRRPGNGKPLEFAEGRPEVGEDGATLVLAVVGGAVWIRQWRGLGSAGGASGGK